MFLTDDRPGTFDPEALNAHLASFGHSLWLGHRYHAHGPGWVELAMPWHEDLVADETSGAFAPGPVIALMDNAAGTSVWLRRGRFGLQVTIDLRVDFVRPTTRGATLVGRCECYEIGYETTPDDPACSIAGTFMLLDVPAA
jgi:uncharacterized protein (TIGR00369 family)